MTAPKQVPTAATIADALGRLEEKSRGTPQDTPARDRPPSTSAGR